MRADERSDREPPSDAAVISNGMVALLREVSGRDPTKARTTIGRDHVLVMLHDVLTPIDKTLVTAGHGAKVLVGRHALQEAMRPQAVRVVEETIGRKVVGFLSANNLAPDVAAEVFVLSPLEVGASGVLAEDEARRGI